MSVATLDQVRELARNLPPQDKRRLIDELAHQLFLEQPAVEDQPDPTVTIRVLGPAVRLPEQPTAGKRPHPSLWGALAHLGPAPSAEEIDEARREAWANFPREDI